MDRIAYVDGAFVPFADAKISVTDRGFLFADGIYEVSAVLDGKLVDNEGHLTRLDRSLREIRIANPHTLLEWVALQKQLIEKNTLREGVVYIQVTRGAAERDFGFPDAGTKPTVVMFTQVKNLANSSVVQSGAKIISVPDIRWERRDIKSVALLAQVLAKQAAAEAGAAEAWMVQGGLVTEGGSSTAFIITRDGTIRTRPLSHDILPGITRRSVMALAKETGLKIEERAFSIDEAKDAAEAFITSASSFVTPVVAIDGAVVGDGAPGKHTKRLRELYLATAREG